MATIEQENQVKILIIDEINTVGTTVREMKTINIIDGKVSTTETTDGKVNTSNISDNEVKTSDIADDKVNKIEIAKVTEVKKRLGFKTLAIVMMCLAKDQRFIRQPSDNDSKEYWKSIAEQREQDIRKATGIIQFQRQRIERLERDLQHLMAMARETQQLLASMKPQNERERVANGESKTSDESDVF